MKWAKTYRVSKGCIEFKEGRIYKDLALKDSIKSLYRFGLGALNKTL